MKVELDSILNARKQWAHSSPPSEVRVHPSFRNRLMASTSDPAVASAFKAHDLPQTLFGMVLVPDGSVPEGKVHIYAVDGSMRREVPLS